MISDESRKQLIEGLGLDFVDNLREKADDAMIIANQRRPQRRHGSFPSLQQIALVCISILVGGSSYFMISLIHKWNHTKPVYEPSTQYNNNYLSSLEIISAKIDNIQKKIETKIEKHNLDDQIKEITELPIEVKALQNRIKSLEDSNKSLVVALKYKETEIENLQIRIESLDSSILELIQKFETMSETNSNLISLLDQVHNNTKPSNTVSIEHKKPNNATKKTISDTINTQGNVNTAVEVSIIRHNDTNMSKSNKMKEEQGRSKLRTSN